MKIVIFDDQYRENFYPLTLTRPVSDLRVGVLKLRQRLQAYLAAEAVGIFMDPALAALFQERHPDWQINQLPKEETIFVNSRLKISDELAEKISKLPASTVLKQADIVLAARLTPTVAKPSEIFSDFDNCQKIEIKAELWQYLWELVAANSNYLQQDFDDFFYDRDNHFETEMGITILDPYNIWLGAGCKIAPGVVIDASEGPVILDENVKIMPNAVLIGPCYIGKNSTIKVGAKIYEGTSIGPRCKIGGEVEESIILGYSNKQHDGFLGHSYLGEWINLGADSNNSDLKNNYGNVKLYDYASGDFLDSQSQFMGMIMGDHSKTGINSTINTGTVIGVACNLYGRNLIDKFVPDFSWGEFGELTRHRLDKFYESADLVKQRRDKLLSDKEKELYKKIFQNEFTHKLSEDK
ncbi:MAG: putative sugar nucleotidyl transferase [Candidatus Cloacimonadales bacterium]